MQLEGNKDRIMRSCLFDETTRALAKHVSWLGFMMFDASIKLSILSARTQNPFLQHLLAWHLKTRLAVSAVFTTVQF